MSDVRPEWYDLRNALERADVPIATALLQNDPSLIDERNGIGETVLHFLAVENNQAAVEWIHSQGANLNATNKFGTPLLFEVAQLGHRDLYLWLVRHGADPTVTDSQGQRIEDYLTDFGETEMVEFIRNGKPRC